MKKLFLGLVLLAHAAVSQATDPYFTSLRTENGLSHNQVNCILQDTRGFLWFGTEDGLNRYDGKYFTVFKNVPNDTTSLSGNRVTGIVEDCERILWIATADGGITKYDYRLPPDRQFRQFKYTESKPGGIPENHIRKLVDDHNGYLWLATSASGVVRFNKQTERFDVPVKTGATGILSLMLDDEGILWVGREGGGLLQINTRTLVYEEDARYQDLYARLPHASVTALFGDSEQDIWYGSWDKVLYRYHPKTGAETVFTSETGKNGFASDEIRDFAEDQQKRIWMASKETGLMVYDRTRNRFTTYQHNPVKEGTLTGNCVNTVYVDRTGIVWVGTSNGISKYNPLYHPFRQVFLPGSGRDITIYDFYKEDSGPLWIGTSEGIFLTKDGQSFEHRPLRYQGQPLAVTRFFKDVDGTLYLGTDYTLFTYDFAGNKVSPLPNTEDDPVMNKLIASRITSIVRDTIGSHPALIVSPYGHYLTYYDLTEKVWVSRIDSVQQILRRYNIKDNLIRKLHKSPDGGVWLATSRYGLGNWLQQNAPQVKYFTTNTGSHSSITSDDVYDVQPDQHGGLWVSTYGGGLNHFNPRTSQFSYIQASSNLTEGMQTDARDNLWMICNGHMHQYDPSSQTYSCYDLPSLRSDGGLKGYMYQDGQGNLYAAGGANYYVVFNPREIARINSEPTVYLTDFQIFEHSHSDLLEKEVIELNHAQNYFAIAFSAPDFSGDNIQYSYRLEGLDQQWTDAGKRTFASYSNLPAGEYRFTVRASNWKGRFGSKTTSVVISITPPFWRQAWFYVASALLVGGLGYGAYRYRINELLKRQAIRNGIAQDLHDHIGSTLSSISVYSQVAAIYQNQHKTEQLQQVLHTIGETSNEMISEMADIVWTIQPKNDQMDSIVQRIDSYARPLCRAKNIRFDMRVDPRIHSLDLAMLVRKNLFLIIKEAINNALKYADCSTITVEMKLRNNQLEVVIQDNGAGYDADTRRHSPGNSLSGNGLPNMQKRAQEMNALLEIRSAPDRGTRIGLSMNIP